MPIGEELEKQEFDIERQIWAINQQLKILHNIILGLDARISKLEER
ncbi:hypothetical protein KAR91_29705 [Candidatus Pacearchaeota archaeon]|nr:hypothetical protein [Candidatus Pacearchaeota archaeon]